MQSNFSKEELKDIIQWDMKNWKNALPFWSAHFDIKEGMKVLALGEREGGLSLYFAKLGCEVVCSDYDDFPDATKEMHERYDVHVNYAKVDMRDIPFDDASFDAVVFKSVLGAITDKAEQDQCMREIHRVLKPGGALLFAENTKASKVHSYLRKKFIKWAHRWRYPELQEFEDWSTLYSQRHRKLYGVSALFGRTEKQRNFLGSFDRALSRTMPKSWRYIYFGVFIK